LAEEDALHHFRNAVAADRRGPISRHDPDDDGAEDRNEQDRRRRAVSTRGRDEGGGDSAVEREVGDEPDEARQQLGGEAGGDGDEDRERGDDHGAPVDRRSLLRCANVWRADPDRFQARLRVWAPTQSRSRALTAAVTAAANCGRYGGC